MQQIPEQVRQYYRELKRIGAWPVANDITRVSAGMASAGEVIQLQVKWVNQCVVDSCYLVYGCPYAIAVAGYCADWVIDKSCLQLSLMAVDLIQALNLPQHKYHSALVGEELIAKLRSA